MNLWDAVIDAWKRGQAKEASRLIRRWATLAVLRTVSARIDSLPLFGADDLLPELLCPLISRLLARGDREQAAYHINDLGLFLAQSGDRRAVDCFHQSLRLTRSPGRRMRTLGRLGEFHGIILRDAVRARRYYKAAIFVGDLAGYNPLHIEQARFRLKELEADQAGMSQVFVSWRIAAHVLNHKRTEILSALRIPTTLAAWHDHGSSV